MRSERVYTLRCDRMRAVTVNDDDSSSCAIAKTKFHFGVHFVYCLLSTLMAQRTSISNKRAIANATHFSQRVAVVLYFLLDAFLAMKWNYLREVRNCCVRFCFWFRGGQHLSLIYIGWQSNHSLALSFMDFATLISLWNDSGWCVLGSSRSLPIKS